MRKKMFYTVIKADHKLGGIEYIKGRIHGIMTAICYKNSGNEILQGVGENELGFIIITKTTTRRYRKFAKITETRYPGLCIFDYKKVN